MPIKRRKAANGRCKATNASGKACAAPALRGEEFCSLHKYPERASELGRKGGIKSPHSFVTAEIEAPRDADGVRVILAEAMAEIRAGRMDPKLGSTLGYLGTSLLRAIEVADFEDRLKKLEGLNGLSKTAGEVGAVTKGSNDANR